MTRPTKITIHCTDTKNGEPVDISEIKKWHLARGFSDVGYHAVVQPDGEIQKGRGLMDDGAHVEWSNRGNIGLCMVGKDKFTLSQFKSVRGFIESVSQIYDIKPYNIWMHYEFDSAKKNGKSCPNIRSSNFILWYACHDYESIKESLL